MGPRHGRLGSGPGLSLAGPTVPVRRIPQVVAAVSSCISVGLGLEVPRGLQPLAMMEGGEGASTLQDRWTPGLPASGCVQIPASAWLLLLFFLTLAARLA